MQYSTDLRQASQDKLVAFVGGSSHPVVDGDMVHQISNDAWFSKAGRSE